MNVVWFLVHVCVNVLLQINSVDDTNTTPLHWAAYNGHLQVVHCLICCGAKIEMRNKYGQTPLHWAAMGGSQLAFHLLVQSGANIMAVDNNGYNTAMLAIQFDHPSLAFYAFNYGIKVDATGLLQSPQSLSLFFRYLSFITVFVGR